MKKKNVLIATALTITMAIPLTVFAATSDAPAAKSVRGFFTSKTANLTEQQKADAKDFSQKMLDLKKEYINKAVANGSMTKEDADAAIKKMDEFSAKAEEKGWFPGLDFKGFDRSKVLEKGKEFFKDYKGRGDSDSKGLGGIQLSDQQKADLMNAQKAMISLQKELIAKMAENGAVTQEKADDITKKMDEMAQKLQEKGLSVVMGMPMAGFGGFGEGIGFFRMPGVDQSKLTEEQKAVLIEYANKMTDLRKATIAKMVENKAITQEQADAINKKMDEMSKLEQEKGPFGDRGMMQRGPADRGPMDKGQMDKKVIEKKIIERGRPGMPGKPGNPGNQDVPGSSSGVNQ